MAGYVRQRAAQIVNNSLADADDVKAEFDQLQSAFNSSSGHKHDGTTGEGPPILVTGPNQEYVSSATSLSPKTTAAYDLGTTALRYKDAYFSGGVTATTFTGALTGNVTGNLTGNVTGDVTGNLTGNVTGDVTGALTGNASTATTLQTARNINGTSFNGSAAITTANWGTARDISIGGTSKSVNGSAPVTWSQAEISANIATTLETPRTINGTAFDGSANITTNNWGTSRTLTIGSTGKAVNGSAAVTWTLGEIGAQPVDATLTSLAAFNTNGLLTQTAPDTFTGRTLTGTTNQITITNGNGVSGNPTVSAVVADKATAEAGTDNTRLMTPLRTNEAIAALAPAPAQLTQTQAEDPASTVFGTVSGQRLEQQTNAAFNVSGSAPKYACRAWVNFDGTTTTPSIRASGNVSSVARISTGNFTVNLATAMSDTNYAVVTGGQSVAGDNGDGLVELPPTPEVTTTSFRLRTGAIRNAISAQNLQRVFAAVFR
jgi:hypothetical protein